MNAFILSPGRSGSMTFARACEHFRNYTAGHESRAHLTGYERLAYPQDHIESDNRLSWMLGTLGMNYLGRRVLYVHLHRDPEQVAESLCNNPGTWKAAASIIKFYHYGVVLTRTSRYTGWPPKRRSERMDMCRAYVATVNDNIAWFLRTRSSSERFEVIMNDDESFLRFLDRIDADCDQATVLAEWHTRHNATPTTT
jgi:hypothetical protein